MHRSNAVLLLSVVFFFPCAARANCDSGFALPAPGYINIPGSLNYAPSQAVPNFTPNSKITFWSLTTGDAALLAGDDSGAYVIYLRNNIGAAAIVPYDYSTGTAMVSEGPGPFYNYSMSFSTNWGANVLIDGCIGNIANTVDRCTCALVQDFWRGWGYFGVVSSQADAVGDFSWSGLGMAEIPRVRINSSIATPDDVTVSANLEAFAGGVNNDPACDCTPTGYRVYKNEVFPSSGDPSTHTAPIDRRRVEGGWQLVGAGEVGGADTQFVLDVCHESGDRDVYLAATLTWAGGFETDYVSRNSTKLACGPTLAHPIDENRPKTRATRPLRPTRRGRTR